MEIIKKENNKESNIVKDIDPEIKKDIENAMINSLTEENLKQREEIEKLNKQLMEVERITQEVKKGLHLKSGNEDTGIIV